MVLIKTIPIVTIHCITKDRPLLRNEMKWIRSRPLYRGATCSVIHKQFRSIEFKVTYTVDKLTKPK